VFPLFKGKTEAIMCKESNIIKAPLVEILKSAQDKDNEAQLFLIEKFSHTIKSFAYKLNYDGADTDLIIFLLELCQTIDLCVFDKINEGILVKYIYSSIKHEYIKLSKQNKKYKLNEQLYGVDPSEIANNYEAMENVLYSDRFVNELINILTLKEQQVITYIFLLGYSNVEVARVMSISKQAIGKTKKRALQKLKCKLTKE
jgi:RNA polymerase sigma factor (sigma-70 family)